MRRAYERTVVQLAAIPALSRLTGWLADLHVPGPILHRFIRGFVRSYDVEVDDVAEPLDSFDTFNAFFTRALRPGARPVPEDADVVVSPADARLQTIGRVPASCAIEQIKGRTYRVAALLGDEGEAARYREGVHATLYLSPRDYHRVHCPVDGVVRRWRHIPGRLFPVHGMAVRQVDALFTVNERVVFEIDSERFGPVAVVMVGASNVGRMTVSLTDEPSPRARGEVTVVEPSEPIPIARGDELGRFNLGSTVVMLLADPDLVPTAAEGEMVRMGSGLWSRAAPAPDSPA